MPWRSRAGTRGARRAQVRRAVPRRVWLCTDAAGCDDARTTSARWADSTCWGRPNVTFAVTCGGLSLLGCRTFATDWWESGASTSSIRWYWSSGSPGAAGDQPPRSMRRSVKQLGTTHRTSVGLTSTPVRAMLEELERGRAHTVPSTASSNPRSRGWRIDRFMTSPNAQIMEAASAQNWIG